MFKYPILDWNYYVTDKEIYETINEYNKIIKSIKEYIKKFYKSKGYSSFYTQINLPFYLVEIYPDNKTIVDPMDCINRVNLPFMITELEVWTYLVENDNNPLFELLRCFERSIEYLRLYLTSLGVQDKPFITASDIENNNIYDIFNLRSYEYLYNNVSKLINQSKGVITCS